MPPISETERELQRLEAGLKQLEAEYNMFFAGRLPKPPWETRSRVEAIVKQMDRAYIQNTGDRFRSTRCSRASPPSSTCGTAACGPAKKDARDRFRRRSAGQARERGNDKVMHVASFSDPLREMDKLHDLYDSLVEARRTVGEDAVPFHKFAELVKTQVKKLKSGGTPEVAFRVAVKDGKVNFTARAMKGGTEKD